MGPGIEVLDKKSARVAEFLGSLLADEYMIAVRTRDARRNVYGRNVTGLRKLFGEHCTYLDGVVVEISRRVRALGRVASVTFAHSMKATRLNRHNEKLTGQNQIIEALLDDHESVIRSLTGAGSSQTERDILDFVAGLLGRHLEMVDSLREWL